MSHLIFRIGFLSSTARLSVKTKLFSISADITGIQKRKSVCKLQQEIIFTGADESLSLFSFYYYCIKLIGNTSVVRISRNDEVNKFRFCLCNDDAAEISFVLLRKYFVQKKRMQRTPSEFMIETVLQYWYFQNKNFLEKGVKTISNYLSRNAFEAFFSDGAGSKSLLQSNETDSWNFRALRAPPSLFTGLVSTK